jgi:hypothetical protein
MKPAIRPVPPASTAQCVKGDCPELAVCGCDRCAIHCAAITIVCACGNPMHQRATVLGGVIEEVCPECGACPDCCHGYHCQRRNP